jgi:hypothetical protein
VKVYLLYYYLPLLLILVYERTRSARGVFEKEMGGKRKEKRRGNATLDGRELRRERWALLRLRYRRLE